MFNKFGHIGLNGSRLNWIIGTHGNWKNQNPGGYFGATLDSGIDVAPGINIAHGTFGNNIKRSP